MLDSSKIYKELHGQLHLLDQDREKLVKKVEPFKYFFWSLLIVGGAALIIYLTSQDREDGIFFIITYVAGVVIALIVFLAVHYSNLKKFKAQFTGLIAPKIIKAFDRSFNYNYKGKIREDVIKGCRLFPSFNKYECQDLVTGTIEGKNIQFAEIKLIKTNQGKDSNTSSTVFSGIFFQAELSVAFPTGLWIVPRYHYKALFGDRKERIKISHPALRPYRIYANDPMIAKQVLQPYILDKIGAVNAKLKKSGIARRAINYHFSDTTVQLAMPTTYRFMEPSLNQSIESEAFIKKQTDLINALAYLLKDLTLS